MIQDIFLQLMNIDAIKMMCFYETKLTPVEVACRRIDQVCNIRNLFFISFISLPALALVLVLVLVLALAQVEVYQDYADEET